MSESASTIQESCKQFAAGRTRQLCFIPNLQTEFVQILQRTLLSFRKSTTDSDVLYQKASRLIQKELFLSVENVLLLKISPEISWMRDKNSCYS